MAEWIRFAVVAVLIVTGLFGFASAVVGVSHLGYVLNRIHAAGIGDTFALFFVMLSLAIASGFHMNVLKMFIIVLFMWFTSPSCTHFLSQVGYYTDPDLYRHVARRRPEGQGDLEKEEEK